MSTLETLSTDDLASVHRRARDRYDAFRQRGLKLDLTRGKPAAEQLALSSALLDLPGAADHAAADGTDVRNYGVLLVLQLLAALWYLLAGRRGRASFWA